MNFYTNIVCIRHGESDSNAKVHENPLLSSKEKDALYEKYGDDTALTERGVEQARQTASHLESALRNAHEGGGRLLIVCSPLQRARQTLQAFYETETQTLHAKRHEIVFHDDMIEYSRAKHATTIDFIDQVFCLFAFLQQRAADHDDGHKLVQQRAADHDDGHKRVQQCAADHDNGRKRAQTILLVGHSLTFNVLLTLIATHRRGITHADHRKRVLDRLHIADNARRLETIFHLPNCSVTVMRATRSVPNNMSGDSEIAKEASTTAPNDENDNLMRKSEENDQKDKQKSQENSANDQKNQETTACYTDWCILGVAKCDHLRIANLRTGHHTEF